MSASSGKCYYVAKRSLSSALLSFNTTNTPKKKLSLRSSFTMNITQKESCLDAKPAYIAGVPTA